MGTMTLLSSNPKIERGSCNRTLVSRMKFFRIWWRSEYQRAAAPTAGPALGIHYSSQPVAIIERLHVADVQNRHLDVTSRTTHEHAVALAFAEQGRSQGRVDADSPPLGVDLVGTDDLIGGAVSVFILER